MISLAITDALLGLMSLWVAVKGRVPFAFKLACSLIAMAAFLGAIRFLGIEAVLPLHSFFVLTSASSAFILLFVSIIWPSSAVATNAKYCAIVIGVSTTLALIVTEVLSLAHFPAMVAFLSIVVLCLHALHQRLWRTLLGSAILLLGFILFISKNSLVSWLKPGDILHIFTALGLIVLSRFNYLVTIGRK